MNGLQKAGNLESNKVMQLKMVTPKVIFISATLFPFINLVYLFLNASLFDVSFYFLFSYNLLYLGKRMGLTVLSLHVSMLWSLTN